MRRTGVGVLLLVCVACGNHGSPPDAESAASTSGPLVVLIGDATASVGFNGIPVVTEADVRRAVEALERQGGDFAFGRIEDAAGAPLASATFGAPQPRPEGKGLVAKRLGAHWEAGERSRIARNAAESSRFLQQASRVLASTGGLSQSDVWAQVARAVTFLEQPRLSAPRRKVMVLVTDGEHNTTRARADVPADVEVLVVHGPSGAGVLGGLATASFSNARDAIAHATR